MSDLSVSATFAGGSVVIGQARQHSVTIDRPYEKGGSDAGPMGGELLLLALAGCFASTLQAVLRTSQSQLDRSQIKVHASATLGTAPARFTELHITVSAPASAKEEAVKAFLKAERGCIVNNTLKGTLPVTFHYDWLVGVEHV
jgi:putative redox protein